jgi:hypothetical protein
MTAPQFLKRNSRGKAVLLTFWTRQCSICVDQFAAIMALKEELESSGLEVLSVNRDGTVGAWWRGQMDPTLPDNRALIDQALSK